MIEFLRYVVVYSVVTLLIFFIINNAFNNKNYKKRAIIFLFAGIILLLGMLIAHLLDRFYFNISKFNLNYFAFPIAVTVLTIIIVIINIYKGNKYHHTLRPYKNQQSHIESYLYTIYQYKDNYYLSTQNNNYCGDIVKFNKNVYFHDQMINLRVNNLKLKTKSKNYIGKISATEKQKKFIFYCYLVELECDENLDKFKKVNMFEIQNIKTLDFHKNIILRILIKENFDIKI